MQIINQKETDVKDWSSNIIANDATLPYDLANIKPHPHFSGHQTIQQSFLNCELFEATSLSATDYFSQALNSCRDLSRGWRNQFNLGIVPKCGHWAWSKSRQCLLPSLGASLQGYGQIGPCF